MYQDKNGNKYFKVAFHLHSNISDGKLSPEEIAAAFKEDGYDAITLTDHWRYGESKKICGLHIISGIEYDNGPGSATMHIVGFGMKSDPNAEKSDDRQTIIDKINGAGGCAVLAHPAWSLNSIDDAKALVGFTATEIYNAVSEAGQSLRPYSDHFVDMCAVNEMYFGIFAVDDAHYYGGVDDRRGWVMVKADELNDEAIVRAVKNRDFFASQGPMLSVTRDGDKVIIEASPCDTIAVLSNCAWLPNRVVRGDGITRHEYTFRDEEKWLRVEVRDGDKRAWSNIIVK
ncbi:MAG: hypothetical protein IJY94_03360 [Clostridia bacterium]|nr:hypothetical protein [Clostridia bacterium]